MPRNKQFDEEEILDKAMVIFWEKGYHETSITDLIEGLGLSNASIYHSFKGKRQLFERAFERYRQRSLEGIQAFLSTETDVKAGLRFMFQKVIENDLLDPEPKGCMVVNTTTELLPDDEMMRRVIGQYQLDMVATFHSFLQRGEERGQIPAGKPLGAIAKALYTFMMGLKIANKVGGDVTESNASLEAMLSMID